MIRTALYHSDSGMMLKAIKLSMRMALDNGKTSLNLDILSLFYHKTIFSM